MSSTIKKRVLNVGPPEAEQRRAIDWGEEPVRDRRNELMAIEKRELVAMLEACEEQNKRLKEYTVTYERILQEGKRDRDNLQREYDSLRKDYHVDGKTTLVNMIDTLLQLVAPMHGADRLTAAHHAIKALRVEIQNRPWLAESTNGHITAQYRQLCKWACYVPRPDTADAYLYQLFSDKSFDSMPFGANWYENKDLLETTYVVELDDEEAYVEEEVRVLKEGIQVL